jgi:hypothetical protein
MNLTSDADGGLVHVLLLMPYGSGPGSNGSDFKMDWTSASEDTMWKEGGTERHFFVAYRLFPRRAEIGGKTWSLESQNVFLVRLDDQWRASVEALPLQTYSASSLEVLKRIQDLLPQDREITSLKVME